MPWLEHVARENCKPLDMAIGVLLAALALMLCLIGG